MRLSGYDSWLSTNRMAEAAEARWEAFESWAEAECPDLDWADQDAVDEAEAEFERQMDDAMEARMIDAAEAHAEARWEREMDRI